MTEEEREAPDNCQRKMMQSGKPYPRSCPRCGLGPCPFYGKYVASPKTTPPSVSARELAEGIIETAHGVGSDYVQFQRRHLIAAIEEQLREKDREIERLREIEGANLLNRMALAQKTRRAQAAEAQRDKAVEAIRWKPAYSNAPPPMWAWPFLAPFVVLIFIAIAPLFALYWATKAKRWFIGPSPEWRGWLAWFPVRVDGGFGERVWMERVERRSGGPFEDTEYRDATTSLSGGE